MKEGKKNSAVTVISLFVALISILIFGFVHYTNTTSNPIPSVLGAETISPSFSLNVKDIYGDYKQYQVTFYYGETLFQALKSQENFAFTYDDTKGSAEITSINGVKGNAWNIKVNGKQLDSKIEKYRLQQGDMVTILQK